MNHAEPPGDVPARSRAAGVVCTDARLSRRRLWRAAELHRKKATLIAEIESQRLTPAEVAAAFREVCELAWRIEAWADGERFSGREALHGQTPPDAQVTPRG